MDATMESKISMSGLGMTPEELYEFDINGFLLVDDAVPADLLAECNAVTDFYARREEVYPLPDTAFAAEERGNASKLLNIVAEQECFLRLAMSPKVISRLPELVVNPRLKSNWLQLNGPGRGIGYHSNHTPHNPTDMYLFQGRICAALVTVTYALCDIPEAGGALDVLPGSHKANFALPESTGQYVSSTAPMPHLRRRLPMRAGQALIFSHEVNHGSHNALNYVRRSFFTSFSPGVSAHTLGDNNLYEPQFEAAPEGSWQKYLLRAARGDCDTYPMPKHSVADEVSGAWTPEAKREHVEAALVL